MHAAKAVVMSSVTSIETVVYDKTTGKLLCVCIDRPRPLVLNGSKNCYHHNVAICDKCEKVDVVEKYYGCGRCKTDLCHKCYNKLIISGGGEEVDRPVIKVSTVHCTPPRLSKPKGLKSSADESDMVFSKSNAGNGVLPGQPDNAIKDTGNLLTSMSKVDNAMASMESQESDRQRHIIKANRAVKKADLYVESLEKQGAKLRADMKLLQDKKDSGQVDDEQSVDEKRIMAGMNSVAEAMEKFASDDRENQMQLIHAKKDLAEARAALKKLHDEGGLGDSDVLMHSGVTQTL